jgi:protein-tyrosine phosphatase
MVDIHCHILPGVDDGADSLDSAVEMARMAVESGVDTIIATPHCNLPYDGDKNYISDALRRQFLQLRHAIRDAGLPLNIYAGCEVLCTPEVPALISGGKLLTLAGSRYLLLEFFFDEEPDYMDELLDCVARTGLVPVIAHPERYEAIQRAPYLVERWFRAGYVIQLNKGSILGRLGRRAAEIFKELELKGAHNINLVNPTHFIWAIKEAVKIYRPNIPLVYNSSGYDDSEIIKENIFDIYLMDLKYLDSSRAKLYSSAENYPEIAECITDKTGSVRVVLQEKDKFILSTGGGKVRSVIDKRLSE